MADRSSRSEVHLDIDAGAPRSGTAPAPGPDPRPRPDTPFRVLLLADFSGRAARGERRPAAERAEPAAIRVDRDDLDAALGRLRPRLRIPTAAPAFPTLDLVFERMDDFHPDSLRERVPLFSELDSLRRRPDRPAPTSPPQPADDVPPEAVPADGVPTDAVPTEGILDRILDEEPAAGSRPASDDTLQAYVRRIAAPLAAEAASPDQVDMQRRVDAAIAGQMLEILRDPGFRELESLWRGVEMVVRRVETDERLQIHLVDLSRDELEDELDREAAGEPSALSRTLTGPSTTLGETPWALIIGGYAFGPDDAPVLGRLARAARAAGAPVIAGATPAAAGAEGFEGRPDPSEWSPVTDDAWRSLRASDDARWLGLALPRLLVRLPYGEDGAATDVEGLEEAHSPPRHEDYLWGNPAFACAVLLCRSFSEAGWSMRPEGNLDLERLPLHVTEGPGGARAQPCAESLMTDDAATRLLELGIMPLASFRDQDRVRLVRFQSVADPLAPLAGRWS